MSLAGIAKWLAGAGVVGGSAGLTGGIGMGIGQSLLGSFNGQPTGGADLGPAGGALVPQGGGGSGTNAAPGRTVIVSAPTPAPDPSLKVIVGLVSQALSSLNKIDSNISAQRSEQAAAASASAKQLREATLEGGGKAELAASPQMGGTTGGSGLLGLLGAAAGAAALTRYMTPEETAKSEADRAGSPTTGQPGETNDSAAPNSNTRGNPIFDPLKGAGTGRKQPGLGLPRSNGRKHQGIDLFVPIGTPVYAIAAGKIIYSHKRPSGGFGIAVKIDHGGGWTSAYAHLSEAVFNIPEGKGGKTVKKGQLIGYTGDTGNAKGMTGKNAHLHFEIRYKGTPQEPSQYLTGQKTIPGTEDAEATTNDKPPVKDTADAAPATPKDDKPPQAKPNAPRDTIEDFLDKINPFGKTAAATPTTAPSAMEDPNPAGRKPEAMLATFTPEQAPTPTNRDPKVTLASYTPEQAPTPTSNLSAPKRQDPSDFSDVAAQREAEAKGPRTDPNRLTNDDSGQNYYDGQPISQDEARRIRNPALFGSNDQAVMENSTPVSQPALFTMAASPAIKPAPTPNPGPGTPNIPKPVLPNMPANDNVLTWWEWLKKMWKQGKLTEAIEEFVKKFGDKFSWLKNANIKRLIFLAISAGVSWAIFSKNNSKPEITPAPTPDAKPDAKPDAQPAPSAVIAPDPAPAPVPAPKPEDKPTPTPIPGATPERPWGPPPVPPVVMPPAPSGPGGKSTLPPEAKRIYGQSPGLTFKDREYDPERATGVSRGTGQLGLGRSEPLTGVIGEPLLLPPTPSFTPDKRASAIDSMSREREKSSRAPLKFDSGTPDAYTPPAKTQLARNQSQAASGGSGASPSSVPNPSAYDIVKEYQVYFLNASAIAPTT